MENGQQRKSDVLTEPALVLLGVPVEIEGTDCFEGIEGGVKDDKVDVVTEVDPDAHEEGEVGEDERRGDVIEGFGGLRVDFVSSRISVSIGTRKLTYRKEEVTDVMRYVDGQTHIREMESITQTDQRQRHNMMSDQLLEIFPRFLQS